MATPKPEDLLCLSCRSLGHIVDDCPAPDELRYFADSWSFSKERDILLTTLSSHCSDNDELCQRCEELDILDMFEGELNLAWDKTVRMSVAKCLDQHPRHCRDLGPVSTAEFIANCPLCVALFALLPGPNHAEQHIVLVTDVALRRLDPYLHLNRGPTPHDEPCIIGYLQFPDGDMGRYINKSDALVMEQDGPATACRLIRPDQADFSTVKEWLSRCERLHKLTCSVASTAKLRDISLIDIETESLVDYPSSGCEYIALSYVWGRVTPPRATKNTPLPQLPLLIQHAMILTRQLGRRYLWVDCICIDQFNEEEKLRQIALMADIYRGSFATIVTLCASSMTDGLSRVLPEDQKPTKQISCTVRGKRMVGTMPALDRQIRRSTWASRAWTLQEAVLSPRNIFVAEEQYYFECNAMACCESITSSDLHTHDQTTDAARQTKEDAATTHGPGHFRNMVGHVTKHRDIWVAFTILASKYSMRDMSFEYDTIRAFDGILSDVQESGLSRGFYHGISEDYFDWCLLWYPIASITRRPAFPSWSWAGWKGGIFIEPGSREDTPPDASTTKKSLQRKYRTHFYAWKMEGPVAKICYPHDPPASLAPTTDQPFAQPTPFDLSSPQRLLPLYNITVASRLPGSLILDCLKLVRLFSQDTSFAKSQDASARCRKAYTVTLNDVSCRVETSQETDLERHVGPEAQVPSLALVARDKRWLDGYWYIVHHFLEFHFRTDQSPGQMIGKRTGVLWLIVPASSPQALDHIAVERVSLILV